MKAAVKSAISGKHMVCATMIILDCSVSEHAENAVSILATPLMYIYTHISKYMYLGFEMYLILYLD